MKFKKTFQFDINYLLAVLTDLFYYGVLLAIFYIAVPEYARIIAQASKLVAFMSQVTPDIAGNLAEKSGALKFRLVFTSVISVIALFMNYVLFKGLQWCFLQKLSIGKFFKKFHKYTLLSALVLAAKLIVYSPLILLLWLVFTSYSADAATVLSLILYILFLPFGFIFFYISYMVWPIYLKKWQIRPTIRATFKEAKKIKKWVKAYLYMGMVFAGLLLLIKLIAMTGFFLLFQSRMIVLFWLLVLVFYSAWTKKVLVTFIYE